MTVGDRWSSACTPEPLDGDDRCEAGSAHARRNEESEQFVWWPVLALIGFVVLVAVVIALGTTSTGRYEREQRTRSRTTRPVRTPLGTPPATPRPIMQTVPIALASRRGGPAATSR